jgi:hypothetical protein
MTRNSVDKKDSWQHGEEEIGLRLQWFKGPGGDLATHMPLASIKGEIERISVKRRGNTAIIRIVSPNATIHERNWDINKHGPLYVNPHVEPPARAPRRSQTPQSKASPT